MVKQKSVVHPYHWKRLNHKEEHTIDMFNDLDESP